MIGTVIGGLNCTRDLGYSSLDAIEDAAVIRTRYELTACISAAAAAFRIRRDVMIVEPHAGRQPASRSVRLPLFS
jgi:hypothetical protein